MKGFVLAFIVCASVVYGWLKAIEFCGRDEGETGDY